MSYAMGADQTIIYKGSLGYVYQKRLCRPLNMFKNKTKDYAQSGTFQYTSWHRCLHFYFSFYFLDVVR